MSKTYNATPENSAAAKKTIPVKITGTLCPAQFNLSLSISAKNFATKMATAEEAGSI